MQKGNVPGSILSVQPRLTNRIRRLVFVFLLGACAALLPACSLLPFTPTPTPLPTVHLVRASRTTVKMPPTWTETATSSPRPVRTATLAPSPSPETPEPHETGTPRPPSPTPTASATITYASPGEVVRQAFEAYLDLDERRLELLYEDMAAETCKDAFGSIVMCIGSAYEARGLLVLTSFYIVSSDSVEETEDLAIIHVHTTWSNSDSEWIQVFFLNKLEDRWIIVDHASELSEYS